MKTFHQLTEQVPEQAWAYVPIEKYSHLNTVRVVRKSNPLWDVGIEAFEGVMITDIGRELIDALYDKKHISEAESFKMALEALKDKKTTIKKLAKELGAAVVNRVKIILDFYQPLFFRPKYNKT